VVNTGSDLAAKPGHPDHVELVEVGVEDREEFEALEERIPFVDGFVQNSAVELEPAQLAIQE
jgi:hypothetical protein